MAESFKGIIVFYINVYPELGQDMESIILMIKEMNKPLIGQLDQDGRYLMLFVPTVKEATRIEKIDYDCPFPSYVAQSVEVKKKPIDNTGLHFKGILTLYVNSYPEMPVDLSKIISTFRSVNSDVLKRIADDGRYQLMIIPTTKEANRIDKVDYDSPFPRFVPKSVKPRLSVSVPVKDDDFDEEDDEE